MDAAAPGLVDIDFGRGRNMRAQLTEREQRLLVAIDTITTHRNLSPNILELAKTAGEASTSHVAVTLNGLLHRGLVALELPCGRVRRVEGVAVRMGGGK